MITLKLENNDAMQMLQELNDFCGEMQDRVHNRYEAIGELKGALYMAILNRLEEADQYAIEPITDATPTSKLPPMNNDEIGLIEASTRNLKAGDTGAGTGFIQAIKSYRSRLPVTLKQAKEKADTYR